MTARLIVFHATMAMALALAFDMLPTERVTISGDDPGLLPILAPPISASPQVVPTDAQTGRIVSSYTAGPSGGVCYTAIPVASSSSGAMMTVATNCSSIVGGSR